MDPEIESNEPGENPDNGGSSQVLGVDDRSPSVPHNDPPGQEVDESAQLFSEVNLEGEINAQAKQYVGFNPEIHATNEDGTPRTKKDGSFALKRGRKSGAILPSGESELPDAPTPLSNSAVKTEAAKKINYKALGKVYAGIFIGGTASIIGPEWNPANKEEQTNLENAFSAYAESTGAQDLPPGLALVMTVAMYGAARLHHENTRSKFAALKDKLKIGFLWIKNKVV